MKGRRLIFHFYAMPGYESNPAYAMHFACLRKYADVFDSAKFIISVDDTSDRELIKSVAEKIVSCGFVENTEFVVTENTIYREALTFKTEIVDKMDELSGMTFFAHTKGASNISVPEYNAESILKWIFGCYYLSLEYIEEMHNQAQVYQPYDQRFFFGSFLREVLPENGGGTRYGAEYEGTFFWVNCQPLLDYLNDNKIPVPRNFGRFYAERFPGDLFPINGHIGSHNLRYFVGDVSLYLYCDRVIDLVLNREGEKERFYEKYNETYDSQKFGF